MLDLIRTMMTRMRRHWVGERSQPLLHNQMPSLTLRLHKEDLWLQARTFLVLHNLPRPDPHIPIAPVRSMRPTTKQIMMRRYELLSRLFSQSARQLLEVFRNESKVIRA